MFKIGDFSKLSRVGTKTLRYYDDIGLFKPTHVDSFTGYRYYTVDQLPRLNRIMALKELGFALEQIAQLLEDNLSAEQLQGMLRMKQSEIERHIIDEQQRLQQVQARLQQIATEGQATAYDIVTCQVEAMNIASVRTHIANYSHIGYLFKLLFTVLSEQQIEVIGSPFVRYHDGEYCEDNPDVEACVAVETSGKVQERIEFSTLPAICVATTIHIGPYSTLTAAYGALMNWIAINDYEITVPNREIYLRGPGRNCSPQDYVTEIQFPICKSTVFHPL